MECDVLIVTSVLQAGHSLDRHFVTCYEFLFTDVLTFQEELQFVSRLRYLGRQDVRGSKYAWIEPSKANRTIAPIKRLQSAIAGIADMNIEVPPFPTSLWASVRSEMADTSNRHVHLWRHDYLLSKVHVHNVESELVRPHSRYDKKWLQSIMKRYISNQNRYNS